MKYELIKELDQRTDEWLKLKYDIPLTGTAAYTLLTKGKQTAIINKRNEISRPNKWTSKAAEWGNQQEPVARKLLNSRLSMSDEYKEIQFEELGFIKSLDYDLCGYSPDGVHLVGNEVKHLCEIKCYQMKHAWEVWERGGPDAPVMSQIQWGLFLTGAEFTMFCLYCPMMSDAFETPDSKVHNERRIMIKRIFPDEKYFNKFKERLDES